MTVIIKKGLAAKKSGRTDRARSKVADVDIDSMYKAVAGRFPKTMKRLAE
jgi:hypothetical protein